MKYVFINRSMSKKLKEWFRNHQDIVSGGGFDSIIAKLSEYAITHQDAINTLAHRVLPHVSFNSTEVTSGNADMPFETLTPQEIFKKPAYFEESNYLWELSQEPMEEDLKLLGGQPERGG